MQRKRLFETKNHYEIKQLQIYLLQLAQIIRSFVTFETVYCQPSILCRNSRLS